MMWYIKFHISNDEWIMRGLFVLRYPFILKSSFIEILYKFIFVDCDHRNMQNENCTVNDKSMLKEYQKSNVLYSIAI